MFGHMSPTEFATKSRAQGFGWAALELDDYNNAPRWGPHLHAMHAVGSLAGPWFTEGGNIVNTPADADFAIAELEGPSDYDGIIHAINTGNLPSCRRAVVTNFNTPLTDSNGVPQPAYAASLINAGFECLTEAYINENPNATPDNMDLMAKNLGWPRSQPVFGVYSGPPTLYDPWRDWPGYSLYSAEYVPL